MFGTISNGLWISLNFQLVTICLTLFDQSMISNSVLVYAVALVIPISRWCLAGGSLGSIFGKNNFQKNSTSRYQGVTDGLVKSYSNTPILNKLRLVSIMPKSRLYVLGGFQSPNKGYLAPVMHDSTIGIGINSGMIPLLLGTIKRFDGILLESESGLESGFLMKCGIGVGIGTKHFRNRALLLGTTQEQNLIRKGLLVILSQIPCHLSQAIWSLLITSCQWLFT